MLRGIGYRLQAEAKQLGGLTVRDAIAFLDGCDPGAAGALRAFGEPWLERAVWVRGFGSRLTVAQEHPVRTVTHSVYPWRLEVHAEPGPPYVQITAD
jgi:hypothetical protein